MSLEKNCGIEHELRNKAKIQRLVYSYETFKPDTTGETAEMYNNLLASGVLPKHPKMWEGKTIVDLTANGLDTTRQIAQLLEEATTRTDTHLEQPIEIICNDIAYKEDISSKKMKESRDQAKYQESLRKGVKASPPPERKSTREIALGKIEQFNSQSENVHFDPELRRKNILDLEPKDFPQRVDLLLDRLGGLWYAVRDYQLEGEEKYLAGIEAYFEKISEILSDEACLVVDDYPLGIRSPQDHNPNLSSANFLREALLSKGMNMDEFLEKYHLEQVTFADYPQNKQPNHPVLEQGRISIFRKKKSLAN